MSNKLFKKIRRYAKLRKLRYSACKKVFERATLEEKILYLKEMENAK